MITYYIEPSVISPFTYKQPLLVKNDDAIAVTHSNIKKGTSVKKVTLLNIAGYDQNNKLVSFKPIDCVNNFLLNHHLNNGKLESDQLSRALAHYFEFILAYQTEWDNNFDEDTFDPFLDPPRPTWDFFGSIKAEKLTYLYRQALMNSVLNTKNGLARTTASSYMSVVVNFYKYHIEKGHFFNNPPFQFEVVTIQIEAKHSSMKAFQSKQVVTTDLRLNFSAARNDVGAPRRDLTPFTNAEWRMVQNILTKTKRVIKNVNGKMQMQALAEEYCLAFLTCRFAGMRREEVASLHTGQIVQPEQEINNGEIVFSKPFLYIGIGSEYGSLTKTKGAGNKSRKTIIPSVIMQKLYDYIQTDRYKTRLAKFKQYCEKQLEAGNHALFEGDDAIDKNKNYLFITQNGIPLMARPSDLTSRWVEVRNTVNQTTALQGEMLGSIHNLRATFAVNAFRALLKKMKSDQALAHVSSWLGHEDYKTTLMYLKIAEDMPTGDEIYEDTLMFLGIFDDLPVNVEDEV